MSTRRKAKAALGNGDIVLRGPAQTIFNRLVQKSSIFAYCRWIDRKTPKYFPSILRRTETIRVWKKQDFNEAQIIWIPSGDFHISLDVFIALSGESSLLVHCCGVFSKNIIL
jgi:hypothetical protein